MILTRTQAVKQIFDIIFDFGKGLPQAIEYYNYISCFGKIPVTSEMINSYFNR